MIPKFVIPFIYVVVLVSSGNSEVETNATENNIPSGNIATTLESEFTANDKNNQSNELVKIQLYYECLCPDCRSFDSKAFKSTVIELGSYLDIHIYPFGNAWCGKSMDIDSESIKQCAKGPKGEKLLKFFGEESMKVNYNAVPHILINGVAGSEDHFKEDVCKSIKNPPKECARRSLRDSILALIGL